MRWLPRAACAANNGTLETTKCSVFFAVTGVDPWMTFVEAVGEPGDSRVVDADQVQTMMNDIYEHPQSRNATESEHQGGRSQQETTPGTPDAGGNNGVARCPTHPNYEAILDVGLEAAGTIYIKAEGVPLCRRA